MMKKAIIACVIALAIIVSYGIYLFSKDMESLTGNFGEPGEEHVRELCPLCYLVPIDGVVLVNTQTGDYDYIEVWQPHATLAGEAAPWEVQRDRSLGYVSISISKDRMATSSISMGSISYHFTWEESDQEHYFCEEHEMYRANPYVIVDTKADPFKIYPVESGQEYSIRLNDLTISSEDDRYTIDIVSHLYDKEMEEWDEGED